MKNKLWHTPKLRLLSAFLAAAMALTMLPRLHSRKKRQITNRL